MLGKIQSKPALALFCIALPGILHFFIFKYIPMFGNIIVFQDYDIFKGMFHSEWIGFQNFVQMFTLPEFGKILRNTLILSIYNIVFGFPAPLILAILLNEIRRHWFKRVMQTMLYLPHFLSWIIVGGMFMDLLSVNGIINNLVAALGLPRVDFVSEPLYFRGVLVTTTVWKDIGWGMIIYLAAIAGINPNLYEAAQVDGASRWRQMWSITLPSLMPAIIILLLLRIGHMLDSNVEQVLVFLNPLVRDVGEVVDTYVYRVGLLGGQFSYTTAIGIFKSVIGFTLIVGLNNLSKKLTGESIY
jgi:putative aldouronate transport system permease protein